MDKGFRGPISVGGRCLDQYVSTAVAEGFEVVDLDAVGVLEALSDSDLEERRATARKLALAYQWAVLHPAPEESSILESPESLGGEGTPEVAAFTAEPLAVPLRITPSAAAALVGALLVDRAQRRRPSLATRFSAASAHSR